MTNHLWQLPWKDELVPHAVLDILRGCNITCRDCYNLKPASIKPFDEIRREFQTLLSLRRLDSVSLLGGEPTLHPQLCDIVRMIKAEGVSVEIFTNGLLLEAGMLHRMRDAGVDLIFLHIDVHQTRPDLGEQLTAERLREHRALKAAAVFAAGMEVGLTMTAYADALAEIDEAVKFVATSPHVDYLVVTLNRNVATLGPIVGDIAAGMHADRPADSASTKQDCLMNEMIRDRLYEQFKLQPFAYLGSNRSADDLRWMSYLIGTTVSDNRSAFWTGLKVSWAERLFLSMYRHFHSRYPFYLPQSPRRFQIQLLLNALTGGAMRRNLKLFYRSIGKRNQLRTKRLLFQSPAQVADDGTIIHCSHCPDAVLYDGRLVPVCISDQIISDRQPAQD